MICCCGEKSLDFAQIFCDNLALLGQRAWDGTPCPSNGWDCLFLHLGTQGGRSEFEILLMLEVHLCNIWNQSLLSTV